MDKLPSVSKAVWSAWEAYREFEDVSGKNFYGRASYKEYQEKHEVFENTLSELKNEGLTWEEAKQQLIKRTQHIHKTVDKDWEEQMQHERGNPKPYLELHQIVLDHLHVLSASTGQCSLRKRPIEK